MKMTRAEYLKARGWLFEPEGDGFDASVQWIDYPGRGEMLALPDAITVQLARDADRERKEWSGGYDSALGEFIRYDIAEGGDGHTNRSIYSPLAGDIADCKLAEHRKRFAVEFTD